MKKDALSIFGRTIFRARGWDFDPLPNYWEEKQVIIGFPHTSLMDTVMAFAGFAIIRQKGHVMVKQEAFKGPLSPILKTIGAVPVNRKSKSGVVADMVAEFSKRENFQLSLVPEGTRAETKTIRTGFWHIAKAAKVPIVCWYLDNQNRCTKWAGRLMPSDSLEDDLEMIKQFYLKVGYEIPSSQ